MTHATRTRSRSDRVPVHSPAGRPARGPARFLVRVPARFAALGAPRRAARSARAPAVRAVLAALMVLAPAAAAAALDDAERERADALARHVPWADAPADGNALPRARAKADGGPHALGVQTLVIENETRKGAPLGRRRARVYQHDHATGRTRRVLVDLPAGVALESLPLASPHLPLNDAERRWALGRLAGDRGLLERLRDEQRRHGKMPFGSLDELDVKASVFEPTDLAHPCAGERCALLSLFDETRTVFALEPLVRFADGTVETLGASLGGR